MIKAVSIFGFCGVAAFMMGCVAEGATDSNDSVAKTESEIINGTETSGWPSIVALYGKKPGEDKGVLCTSTLIAPTVVLTAAHCVDPAVAGEGLVFSILTAPKLTDSANPSPRYPVRAVHWDQEFSSSALTAGHDIAVVILEAPIPGLTPMKFNRGAIAASSITKARLVGYGLNNGQQQTGAGIKRTAEVPVGGIDDKFVTTGSWFGTTMCSGDSGGPVLATINGEETVIGVNSYGFIQCMGTGNSTRVDSYLSFVNQYVPN